MGAVVFWGLVYLGFAFFFSWWPFNNSSDLLPFSEYDNVNVNAYFYYPNDKEVFLGSMKGASACQVAARNYAYSKNIESSNWGYICCTIEKGSSCYRKIK